MSNPDFQKNYFALLDVPEQFEVDLVLLGEHFRRLQQELHPDRHAGGSDYEQRVAMQYSTQVNQAYTTLRQGTTRALYLLELRGMGPEKVAAEKVSGGFLMEQMELREKLESIATMVDPETVLEHLMAEISADIIVHQEEFAMAYNERNLADAASACVKMQYLEKLLAETEQLESDLLD